MDNGIVHSLLKNKVKRFDGDLVFSTPNNIIINGLRGGNPISYSRNKFAKKEITDDGLLEGDLFGFSSKIGFITNVSSTFHSMIYDFEKDSPEYVELDKRLKLLRKAQGEEIDSAKGLEKKPLPLHWTKFQRKNDSMTDEEKQKIDFENSLIADKRPRFFRHLYHHLSNKYRDKDFEREVWARQFGKSFQELATSGNLSKEEIDGVDYYRRRFPFIENDSVMNMVEEVMVEAIKENRIKLKKEKFNYQKYLIQKRDNIEWVDKYYKNYKKLVAFHRKQPDFSNYLGNIVKVIREEIFENVSTDMDYLLDCFLEYFYNEGSKETTFLWKCFGEEFVERISKNHLFYVVPSRKENGDFEYLWSKYELLEFPLGKVNEDN